MARPGNYYIGTSSDDTLDRRGYTDDWTIDGRGGNDTIYGGSGHDRLSGGRGNDLIYGSVEDLLIDGGGGADTVSFLCFLDANGSGVDARLADGFLGVRVPFNGQVGILRNIENIIGSNYNDFLVGNRQVNELDGGDGNDWLQAIGNGDFLTGGGGADRFDVSPVVSAVRHRTETVTLTDFDYNDLDRIAAGPVTPAELVWALGSANDAEGNLQPAWIGTWQMPSGGAFELIVLGTDAPSLDWFI